jgi:cell division protein FtsQ
MSADPAYGKRDRRNGRRHSTAVWNRPAVINSAANALFGLSAVLALYLLWSLATRLPVFELSEVRVSNVLTRVTRDEIADVVQRELRGNFLTVDLAAAAAAFQKLTWVRRADVRRQWPARLEVVLEEHVALARWNANALVNTHGEVFAGRQGGDLPLFAGPEGTAREITIQYRYFTSSLAAIGAVPVQVRVSPRRAWQVKLDNGMTLELGREQVEARLTRFVGAYDRTIARLGRRIEHADLRYANGFAVRLPDARSAPAAAQRGRRAD